MTIEYVQVWGPYADGKRATLTPIDPPESAIDYRTEVGRIVSSLVALGRIEARLIERGTGVHSSRATRATVIRSPSNARDPDRAFVVFDTEGHLTAYEAPTFDAAIADARRILAAGNAYNW